MRGIAVLLVVLHHLTIPGFEYGYLGVDIFFVISGYVITGYITKQLESGSWLLSEFYRRRVWRLLPCLFAVLTLVMIATLLSPSSYRAEIFQSVPYAVLGVSNIYFFLQSGYFDNESILKPLLHTWSLGVEEQFYIIFAPIFVLLGKPLLKFYLIAILLILAFCALFFINDPNALFYLLPFRVVQLVSGVILFFVCRWQRVNKTQQHFFWRHLLVALLLAICPLFSLMEVHALLAAAVITLITGGVIVVLHGHDNNFLARSFLLIKLGGISYALYVVHWPIVSFFHIHGWVDVSLFQKVIMLALMFLAAILIHVFVENYFYFNRSKEKLFSVYWLLIWGFLLILFSMMNSESQWNKEAQSSQLPITGKLIDEVNYANYFKENYQQRFDYGRLGQCFLSDANSDHEFNMAECMSLNKNKKNIFIIGDSHAAYFSHGLRDAFNDYHVLQSNVVNCLPLINYSKNATCDQRNEENLEFLKNNRIDTVIIFARWIRYGSTIDQLEATLNELRQYQDRVVLMAGVPQYHKDIARILHDASSVDEAQAIANKMKPYTSKMQILSEMSDIAKRTDVLFIAIPELLCENEHCEIVDESSKPIFYDYGHMTAEGSVYIAKKIRAQLDDYFIKSNSK